MITTFFVTNGTLQPVRFSTSKRTSTHAGALRTLKNLTVEYKHDDNKSARLAAYIGNRIRQARTDQSMPLEELARKLCVGEDLMAEYECGFKKASPMMLAQIATALDVKLAYLFGFT